ncbi:uncharacterized protein LOC120340841 [Styela clava]|uniref:uncharacterized protein LOC120340841 n=1 Tax=Styela clava TaxID=7725 RepID=UPI00193A05E1|nr:uncharacterized protein LOC120340841 [Styela clava]XP_039265155.1 uncharacterized protein LOC120340841 [Styela clava]
MGSTNDENDIKKRMHARELVSNTMSGSRDMSSVQDNPNGRIINDRASNRMNLALSGHTTTAKGYVIVPPQKAKMIAFEYEHVPADVTDSKRHLSDTSTILSETGAIHKSSIENMTYRRSDAGIANANRKAAVVSESSAPRQYEFGNITLKGTHINDMNKAVSTRADESHHSREVQDGRDHRSNTKRTTSSKVSTTKFDGSSDVASIREKYGERRKDRNIAGYDQHSLRNSNNCEENLTGSRGRGTGGRRRRPERLKAHSNELLCKQNRSEHKPSNAVGNSNSNRRKYSPYLPSYIQPVVAETSTHRAESNCISYGRRPFAAERSRKISTEMNKFSSTSSSSSSDSDCNSPNHRNSKTVIETLTKSRMLSTETPDTSDPERKRSEIRRRRPRRVRVIDSGSKESASVRVVNPTDNEVKDVVPVRRGRGRPEKGLTRRYGRQVLPVLEDKYVSLPDNYKQTDLCEFGNLTGDGSMAQLTEFQYSQGDVEEERCSNVRKLSSKCDRRTDSHIGTEKRSDGLRFQEGDDNFSCSNGNELIISGSSEANYTRSISPDSVEQPDQESIASDHFNKSVWTASSNTSQQSTPRSPSSSVAYIEVAKSEKRRNKESGSVENIRNFFEVEVTKTNELTTRSTSISKTSKTKKEDVPLIQAPKIKATKVGEDYWPRDEDTERLLIHSRSTSIPSTLASTCNNHYKFSTTLTMQETIDQLTKIASADDSPKPRSSSYSCISGDLPMKHELDGHQMERSIYGKISPTGRNDVTNFPKVQMVKNSSQDLSPCMSSTETLKDGSGEYQGHKSTSLCVDSTTSNPETPLSFKQGRSTHQNSKIKYAHLQSINSNELIIVEGPEEMPIETKSTFSNSSIYSNSAVDLSKSKSSKSMLEQMKELTESLKKMSPPQHPSIATWQKGVSRTEPVLSVSPRGNVTSHPPNLETLNEHPEPPSPNFTSKQCDDRIDLSQTNYLRSSEPELRYKNAILLEDDGGIHTQKIEHAYPSIFSKSDGKITTSNAGKGCGTSSENLNKNSMIKPNHPRGDILPSQVGKGDSTVSFSQTSQSGYSKSSKPSSSWGDTLNNMDFVNESHEMQHHDIYKYQVKAVKKKSRSDPNPERIMDINVRGRDSGSGINNFKIPSSSSEPNVMEQIDELEPLDQFKKYQVTKNDNRKTDEQVLNETSLQMSQRNRKSSMKSRIREQNVAMPVGYSIVKQLMAENNNYSDPVVLTNRLSSTSSSMASEEMGPVQKHQPDTLIEPSLKQFNKVFASMQPRDTHREAFDQESYSVDHHRSMSEPVQNDCISDSPKFEEISSNRGRRAGIIQAPTFENVDTDISRIQSAQSVDTVFISEGKEDYIFPPNKDKRGHDMRLHAFRNLLETEESYLSSLRILYQDYMTPLKHPENHSTCEPRLVDEMFYKIPQLYQHHEKFYENVQKCYEDWTCNDVRLGELFLNSFNKDALLDTYTSYITNYLNAREAVRTAKSKEAFRRFIEQCRSENKEKQGLADLMIKPVQRIPRYELLIKDMLKHTPDGHPDRDGLLIAQKEIHTLAVQMNVSEKEAEMAEKHDRLLLEIEQLVEGCVDLCIPKRRFMRQDIISEIKGANKKDRSLWLFSDLIVCTTRKGRAGSTFRRGSMLNLSMGVDYSNKYKFLWKFPLEDVEHLKGNTVPGRHAVDKQLQSLQNDLEILTSMHRQAAQIECNHVQLDESLKEIISHVSRQIAEKKIISFQPICPPCRVELGISTGDGMKTFIFEFLTDDNKIQFERMFANAKSRLSNQKNRWEPTFMKAIPISRTRAGMQFSCAASNVDDVREVWVCNTDGYVGQVVFLTLDPEPNQTQCITVCHAKICCIAQVPSWERRLVPAQTLLQEVAKGPLVQPTNNDAANIMAWDDDIDDTDEENTSPHSTMSNSSYSPSPYSTIASISEYPDTASIADAGKSDNHNGGAWKIDNDGSTLHGSLEDLLGQGDNSQELRDAQKILAGQDLMWLGTEDGKIHIYQSSGSVRGNKHCVRLSHNAAVQCILYHEAQVFVALSNGDLVIYSRNLANGEWDFENQKTKSKVSSPHAITKMVVIGQKELWCGCQNMIKIIDIQQHVVVSQFPVTNDNKRQIYCMVSCGYGVWIALDKRPQIKLYHTVTHDLLTDVDVSTPVSKMLASADAIIRQHKSACLRITALLVCNDLLWVGTSAGVVLTLTLPKITSHTSALAMPVIPQGLAYGHTGHVRFLASAELADKEQNSLSRGNSRRTSSAGNKRRLSSSSNLTNQSRNVSIIISGGDGYEDFRMNSTSESAGRDDSTNHLLVWRA